MEIALIETLQEFEYCIERGFNPLLDTKHFRMIPELRREIQKFIFGETRNGKRDIPQANDYFYHYMWDSLPHYCEECLLPLPRYSATFISHILTRGAHPEMAHDPRNVNILCFRHHEIWESDNRKGMRIFRKNERTIELLKADYQ